MKTSFYGISTLKVDRGFCCCCCCKNASSPIHFKWKYKILKNSMRSKERNYFRMFSTAADLFLAKFYKYTMLNKQTDWKIEIAAVPLGLTLIRGMRAHTASHFLWTTTHKNTQNILYTHVAIPTRLSISIFTGPAALSKGKNFQKQQQQQ